MRLERPERIGAAAFGALPDGLSPLYQRVCGQLRSAIASGKIAAGAQLPTEGELALHFGVSSITIRGALKELQDVGLIERRQGSGTFARPSGARTAEWGIGSVEDWC